jgi:hypothetical protein
MEWRLAWKSTANGIHGRADPSAGKIDNRLATDLNCAPWSTTGKPQNPPFIPGLKMQEIVGKAYSRRRPPVR